MIISPGTSSSNKIKHSNDNVVSLEREAYFGQRLKNRYHGLVLEAFAKAQREDNLSKLELAGRVRRRPEQITRWLSNPSNMTLDTLSLLLLGICNGEPEVGIVHLNNKAAANFSAPEWYKSTYVSGGAASENFSQEKVGKSTGFSINYSSRGSLWGNIK
ncbi:hypothetical protein AA23498_3580 [Acetobacter nitrogenifigens DSM 23921 = NBRC 105050]|uniref:HTH cro/C1-type domain-containing protein n=1 Tax=Acetobacter nitrogenifigens DSM 23921 = NBRC 105050 TaxID=1120919 RepID=A0A511XE75_9PROT|nr:hypothetical protein [Acetobacter nitrogenifigens]GBQ99879.1 hypothetical protein AA23498_3580 [Acetobacter nitrogenifigens DSM 23921 = NBRC 105050]GEN61191.1 hypothetical protein ANI02nite_30750 [Acetobacter nitrogenifigens DSM 23921 = NBRC 105050]